MVWHAVRIADPRTVAERPGRHSHAERATAGGDAAADDPTVGRSLSHRPLGGPAVGGRTEPDDRRGPDLDPGGAGRAAGRPGVTPALPQRGDELSRPHRPLAAVQRD